MNGHRHRQLKASFFRSLVALLDTLKSAQNSIELLQDTMRLVQDNSKPAQVQLAVNMLRQCVKRNLQLPMEAVVQYLSSFYPIESPAASEDSKRWLRSMLEKMNEANLSKTISDHILGSWNNYHEAKRHSFNACQKGTWIWIETASSLEDAKNLGTSQDMKSMQLYVQKANAPLEEIVLDDAYYRTNRQQLPEFLSSKWAEHSNDFGPQDHKRDASLVFYALVSSRASVDVNFSALPTCSCEFPRCCCPSICYCFVRCWESLRCAYRRQNELLLDQGYHPDYENRRCSLVFCSLNLVSQLQEQLLTTLGFAAAFCIFNLINVVVGVLDGCEEDAPLPCNLMLVQRGIGVLCTCTFIASTTFCLRKENFKHLDPLVSMFEMTAGLEKLARQAQHFKDGLGSMDELCKKVQESEKAKKEPLQFITSFSDSDSRDNREEMEESIQGFLRAMGPKGARPVGFV